MSITAAYQPADWADVAEPSDQELAEIEAAVDAAEPVEQVVTLEGWCKSTWAQQALKVVGLPDGSGAWGVRFFAELLGYFDACQEAARSLNGLTVTELEEMRHTYREAVRSYRTAAESEDDTSIEAAISRILLAGLDLAASAHYLEARPLQLARWLCRSNPEGLLVVDELLRDGVTNWNEIARRSGTSWDVVARHAARLGIASSTSLGGSWCVAPDVKKLGLRLLVETDMTYSEVARAVEAETGTTVKVTTVKGWARRAGLMGGVAAQLSSKRGAA